MNHDTVLNESSKVYTFILNNQPCKTSKGILTRNKVTELAGVSKSKKIQVFEIKDGVIRHINLPIELGIDENYTRRFLVQEGEKYYKYSFLHDVSHWGRPEISECELRNLHNVPEDKEIYEGLITTTEEASGNGVLVKTKIKRVPIPRNSIFSFEGKNGIMLGYVTS